MNLEELVGKRLVIGIPGTKITPEIVNHFKELRAGGLILYRINFENPGQLKKLIQDLELALQRKLLVMADHEGGRVIMFEKGVTIFPDNLALGKTEKIEYARLQGKIEAKELRRLGIDVNLSPVLDVLTDAYSPNIGIRSYGKDWKLVSEMGCARIKAMQEHGLSACAKHFPGKGHAPVDAHLGLPVIQSSWAEMKKSHLKPFIKAIEIGIDMIMSSHPYYPKLDPTPQTIATFSRKIIHDTLRKELNFKGIISSDDLEMGAIKAVCPIGEAAVKAVQAGHDILLVCHDLNAQKEVFQKLVDAYKSNQLPIKELEESTERINQLQNKRRKRFEGDTPHPEKNGEEIVQKITRESVTILLDKNKILPLKTKNNSPRPRRAMLYPTEKITNKKMKKTLIIFPRFSELAKKIMIEKELQNEKKFLLNCFKQFNLKPNIFITAIEPLNEEIEAIKLSIENVERIILFCIDAHLYASNKKLLELVQDSKKEVIIILLRDPYDIEMVKKSAACITNFGYRACQIKACIDKIFLPSI
ncbi:MAG: beta-N-acetylhexosaminidase [Elusimicrobia bacterium]|nr:beta-N-acetylhexosaminidase [Elusimicrobiota bacterium]